jgi:hypothetical protein
MTILSLYTKKMKAAKWVNLLMKHRIMVRWQESILHELHEQVLKTVAQGGKLS